MEARLKARGLRWFPGGLLSAVWGCLVLVACAAPLDGGDPSTGTLVVEFPGGSLARTIMPDFADEMDSLSVTVAAPGFPPRTQSSLTPSDMTFRGLPPATWSIEVSVLKNGVVLGVGTASVAVAAGSSVSVTIPVVFSGFASGAGSLALTVDWPDSTGVDYLAWSLDGGPESAATVSNNAGIASATLVTALASGVHTLALSFKIGGAGGAPAGSFVEVVDIWDGFTSDSWVDPSGTLRRGLSLGAADFLDSNPNLAGLVVRDGASTGPILPVPFSSGTTTYDLYDLPGTGSIVFVPTESAEGQYLTYTWNGVYGGEAPSGNASAPLAFTATGDVNTLDLAVRAPDGTTTKTYTLTWHSSSAGVEVGLPGSYTALTFADSAPTVLQGTSVSFQTDNSVLAGIGSGWTWYLDGVAQGETSQRLTLDSAATGGLLGTYYIAATVVYAGTRYSGSLVLTVHR